MPMVKDRNTYGDFCEDCESSYPEAEYVLRGLDLCRRLCPTLLAPICRRQSAFRTGGFGGHEVEVSSIEMQEFVHNTTSFYRINANFPCCIAHLFSHLRLSFNYLAASASTTLASGNFSANPHPHFTQDAATRAGFASAAHFICYTGGRFLTFPSNFAKSEY